MHAIVLVAALAAAAVVAGVVYSTRQDPAQPRTRCKKGVGAVIVPGVPSKNIAAVRAALSKPASRAARAIEALAAENPKDPVVQFNYGWALYCGGFDLEAVAAFRTAKKDGVDYEVAAFPWVASGRALASDASAGQTKLLLDPGSRRILGAAIVGTNAGELIAEVGLALEMGANAEDVALTVHAHPTLSESIGLAAEIAEGTITDLPPKRKRKAKG